MHIERPRSNAPNSGLLASQSAELAMWTDRARWFTGAPPPRSPKRIDHMLCGCACVLYFARLIVRMLHLRSRWNKPLGNEEEILCVVCDCMLPRLLRPQVMLCYGPRSSTPPSQSSKQRPVPLPTAAAQLQGAPSAAVSSGGGRSATGPALGRLLACDSAAGNICGLFDWAPPRAQDWLWRWISSRP